jgi:hypothetical protein
LLLGEVLDHQVGAIREVGVVRLNEGTEEVMTTAKESLEELVQLRLTGKEVFDSKEARQLKGACLNVDFKALWEIPSRRVGANETGQAAMVLFEEDPRMDVHTILKSVLAESIIPLALGIGSHSGETGATREEGFVVDAGKSNEATPIAQNERVLVVNVVVEPDVRDNAST